MPDFATLFAAHGSWMPLIAAAAFVGGFMRGLMGFGGALIFVPATAAFLSPPLAVACTFFFDLVVQIPLLWKSIRHAYWREIAVLAVAGVLATPLGVAVLVVAEPETLRWVISGFIMATVAALAAGFRPKREPGAMGQAGVGALAGFFGGAAGIPGPPVILFYLTGTKSAVEARANMIIFFAFTTFMAGFSFAYAGLLTREAATLALTLIGPVALGVWLGTRAFRLANDRSYRRIGFALIVFVAVSSLPAFDAWLGR